MKKILTILLLSLILSIGFSYNYVSVNFDIDGKISPEYNEDVNDVTVRFKCYECGADPVEPNAMFTYWKNTNSNGDYSFDKSLTLSCDSTFPGQKTTHKCRVIMAGDNTDYYEFEVVYYGFVSGGIDETHSGVNLEYDSYPYITGATPSSGDYTSNQAVYVYTNEGDTPCRWSTSDVSYNSMNDCGGTGTAHYCTTFSDGSHNFYAKCRGDGHTTGSVHRSYNIDTSAPSITSVSPSGGNYGEGISSISVTTDESAACRWDSSNVGYDSMSDSCGSGTTHTCSVSFTSDGTHEFYTACRDSFDHTSSTIHQTYNIDSDAPGIISVSPEGGDYNHTISIINVTTDEDSTCRWDSSNVDYNSMSNDCSGTGVSHECTVNFNSDDNNNFYVACRDSMNNVCPVQYYNYVVDLTNPWYTTSSSTLAFNHGDPGAEVNWILYDNLYPSLYEYWYENTLQETSSWTNETSVLKNVDTNNEGLYNYTIIFNDSSGRTNSSTVMVSVSDITPPTIFVDNPITGSLFDYTSIMMNLSLDEESDWCGAEYNGFNHSMTKYSDISFGLIDDFYDGTHNIGFWCNDSENNMGHNNTIFETDTQNPNLFVSANDTLVEFGQDWVNVSMFCSDPNEDFMVLNVSYPGGGLVDESSGSSIILGPSSLIELGEYSVMGYCNDSLGHDNLTSSSFIVDDSVPPSVSLKEPDDNVLNSENVFFNCSADDNYGLKNSTLYSNWSNGWIPNGTKSMNGVWDYSTFSRTLPTGFYEWNCLVCDDNNNCGFAAQNNSLFVDADEPIIDININDTLVEFGQDWVNVSMFCSDPNEDFMVLNVSYPGGGLVDESSGSSIILGPSSLIELGEYSVMGYCNDSLGHDNLTSSSFIVDDSVPPEISIINPDSSTIYTNNYVMFNITTDEESDWCGVSINSEPNKTMDELTSTSFGLYDYDDDGVYNIDFYCNDTETNVGNSSTTFTVDTTQPFCELLTISVINNNPYWLSVNANDATSGINNVTYSYNNDTSWLIGSNDISPYNVSWSIGPWLENSYVNIKSVCYDNAGWSDESIENNVLIDFNEETPYAKIKNIPEYSSGSITLNATESYDNDPEDALYYTYQISNDSNNFFNISGCISVSGVCDWNTTTTYTTCPDNSECYVRSWVNDDAVYNTSRVLNTIIDNSAPILSNVSPLNDTIMYGSSWSVTCNATDIDDNLTYSAWMKFDNGSGKEWYELTNSSNNISYVWNISSYNTQEDIEYKCNVSDSSNNVIEEIHNNIALEKTPPAIIEIDENLANESIMGSGQNLTLGAHVYDSRPGVSSVFFKDYGFYEYSVSNLYYYNITCDSTHEYWWEETIIANDSFGNEASLKNETKVWYCDTAPPLIENCTLNSTLLYDGEIVKMSCDIIEQGYSSVKNASFNTTEEELTAVSGIGNEWYYDFTCNKDAYTNDSLRNENITWTNTTSFDMVNNFNKKNLSRSANCDPYPPNINNFPLFVEDELPKDSGVCLNVTVTDSPLYNHMSHVWLNISLRHYGSMDKEYYIYYMNDEGCSSSSDDDVYSYELFLEEYGDYTIESVHANDTGNQISDRYVGDTITSYDNNPPIILNHEMVGNTILISGEEVMLRARVQDDGVNGVDDVLFNIQKTNLSGTFDINYSYGDKFGDWYSYNITCDSDADYNWTKIFADDTRDYSVYEEADYPLITCDVSSPTDFNTIVHDPDLDVSQPEGFCVSTAATDLHLDSVWAMLTSPTGIVYNYTLTDTGSDCSGTEDDDIYGARIAPVEEPGNWTVNTSFANDTYNHVGFESPYPDIIVRVMPEDSPLIWNCGINNSLLKAGDMARFSCSITDDEGIDTVLFETNQTNITITDEVNNDYYKDYSCIDTTYEVNWTMAYANDTGIPMNETYKTLDEKLYCDVSEPVVSNALLSTNTINLGDSFCINASITDNKMIVNPHVLIGTPNNTLFVRNLTQSSCGCCGTIDDDIYGADIQLNDVGDYTVFNISVSDRVGNMDDYLINEDVVVSDVFKPVVSNIGVVPNGTVNQYSNIYVNATITDYNLSYHYVYISTPSSSMKLYLNDSINSPEDDDIYGTYFNLTERGYYNISYIFANDTYSNENNFTFGEVITSQDVYSPTISDFNAVPNGTVEIYNNITVNATITDNDELKSTFFSVLNPDNSLSYYDMSNYGSSNYSGSFNITHSGNYTIINITAVDMDDNIVNNSYYEIIYSNDTITPVVANISITPQDSINQYGNVCVNATITDNDELDNVFLFYEYPDNTLDSLSMNENCSNYCCGTSDDNIYGVWLTLTEPGEYYFQNIDAIDVSGNHGFGYIGQYVESIDVYPPVVEISSPVNATYDTNNITLSFEVYQEDYVNRTWYNIDDETNITCNTTEELFINNGYHIINVFANDSYNNVGGDSVSFTVNSTENVKDLSVESMSIPSEKYSNQEFTLTASISNQGTIDAPNAVLEIYDNNDLYDNDTITVLENETITYEKNMSLYETGNHKIKVRIVPLDGEQDTVDNTRTNTMSIISYIDEISANLKAPDIVSPSSNFTSKIYVYNMGDYDTNVINELFAPENFTIYTVNPFPVIVYSGTYSIPEWDMKSPSVENNYTLSSSSWINDSSSWMGAQPGSKNDAEIIEVTSPKSPLFSIDITVLPEVFNIGDTNTVIADVYNYGNETANNTNVTIQLSNNLELVSGNYTHYLGNLTNGTSNTTSWIITPNSTIGEYNISVFAQYDGGSDSDNETIENIEETSPNITITNISYDNSVENNTQLVYNIEITNNGDEDAYDVEAEIILGSDTIGGKTSEKFDLLIGESEELVFNFTPTSHGSSKSFKTIVEHTSSSYYYEENNPFSVWLDSIPPNPTNISLEKMSDGKILIRWELIDDAVEYLVYRGSLEDFGQYDIIYTGDENTDEYLDDNVSHNTWYYYYVITIDHAGNRGNESSEKRIKAFDEEVFSDEIHEYRKSIEDLEEDLGEYEDEEKMAEKEAEHNAEVNAKINQIMTDMNYFKEIKELLSVNDRMHLSLIRSSITHANNAEDPEKREQYLLQAEYELNLLSSSYDISESLPIIHRNEYKNLTVITNESYLNIEFNSTDYMKYRIIQNVTNTYDYRIEDINLVFGIPNDAILEGDNTVSIDRLNPGESYVFNYTYYTYGGYNNSITGVMTEHIPPPPPTPPPEITGYTVFEEVSAPIFTTELIVIIWTLVFFGGIMYFKKDTILGLYEKHVSKEEKKEAEDYFEENEVINIEME